MLLDLKIRPYSDAVSGALFAISALLAAFVPAPAAAQTGEPIKIGYSMAIGKGSLANSPVRRTILRNQALVTGPPRSAADFRISRAMATYPNAVFRDASRRLRCFSAMRVA